MSEAPTGTVTFLLADIVGSTGLQHQERLDYPAIVGGVRRLLRDAVAAHAGYEIGATGDELLAAFSDAGRALEAALAAQRGFRDAEWPDGARVQVRIGLHAGRPSVSIEGYTGLDVVRASRIANAGHGDQILASAATLEPLHGVFSRDLGEHRSRGFRTPSASTRCWPTTCRAISRRCATRAPPWERRSVL